MRPVVRTLTLLLTLIPLLLSGHASAGGGRCTHCSCDAQCQKVCRLVKEEKKIEVVCWGCECVDFCLPRPSQRGSEHCEPVCVPEPDKEGKQEPCSRSKTFVWTDWIPGCGARIHTKKKLMKKVVVKKVPSFKWVVEYLCPRCETKAVATAVPYDADAAIPLPPVLDAKLIAGEPR